MSLEQILLLLQQYGYFILFPLAVIEGPIIGVIGGLLVALGSMDFFVTAVVLMVADLVGDAIYYAIGRWGQHYFSNFITRKFKIGEVRFQKLKESFHKHDVKIMLITKTQALGSVVLLLAGVVHMPFWRFIWWNTVGTIPKVLLFMFIGYFFGQSLSQVETYIKYTGIATLAFAIIGIGLYWRFSIFLKKNLEKELSI